MKGYIYKCTYNHHIYIGESLNGNKPRYLGTGILWSSIIKGHEKEVSKEILEIIEDNNKPSLKQKMHKREIYWIDYFNSTDPNIGYNISPGGNTMSLESLQKMKKNDSIAIKHIMETTDCREKISASLKMYKQINGVSLEHRKNLSDKLKGRKVGGDGDSRSIQVYCTFNGNKYSFHNKIIAAKWWFDTYPFSINFAEITYTRMITKSILGQELCYNKKPINQDIQWFEEVYKLDKNTAVYCILNDNKITFDNMLYATQWWHIKYPIMEEFNQDIYIEKLIKNVKGFNIYFHSKCYNKIKWYRKD